MLLRASAIANELIRDINTKMLVKALMLLKRYKAYKYKYGQILLTFLLT